MTWRAYLSHTDNGRSDVGIQCGNASQLMTPAEARDLVRGDASPFAVTVRTLADRAEARMAENARYKSFTAQDWREWECARFGGVP